MDSGDPSGKHSDSPEQRWAKLLGNLIAIITLTLPLLAIASYSSQSSLEPFPLPPSTPVDSQEVESQE